MTDHTKTDAAWTEISAAYQTLNFKSNYSTSFSGNTGWLSTMMNRIGLTRTYGVDNFVHPFVKYNRGVVDLGDTIQTYKTKKINPTEYNADDQTSPFTTAKNPPIAEYYTLDVAKKYKVTITQEQIAKAFASEQNLGNFVADQMAVLQESDLIDQYTEWKEYISSTSTFVSQEYDPTTDDIYEVIRSLVMDFRTPSKNFNKEGDLAVTTGNIDVILTKDEYLKIGTKLGGVYNPNYIALGDVTLRWVDDFATPSTAVTPWTNIHALICDDRALNRWVRTPQMWSILNSETGAMNYVYKLESIYGIDRFRNAVALYSTSSE